MKKARKVLAVVLALVLTATLSIAGTIAYLQDTDNETNVFTIGNVEIDLKEDFVQNSKLFPGVDVNKDVWVENTGSEEAYVRVHIAFPKVLDSGDPEFAAYANKLHWNFTGASVADGQWNWHKTNVNSEHATMKGWPGNGGAWNSYEVTLDGVEYTVYVATYETKLDGKTGDTVVKTATTALDKVYLDTTITNEDLFRLDDVLGGTDPEKLDGVWDIKVVAEGGQVAGFEDAYTALNTQFGVPSATNNPFLP